MDPDFYYFLRCKFLAADTLSDDDLEILRATWEKSAKRGKFEAIFRRKARQRFGPGRFHASSSGGVFLNKRFVKGWRGVNPEQP